jgi:hypothetical protein
MSAMIPSATRNARARNSGTAFVSQIATVKASGGTIALEKMPVPGVGWLAYAKDTEGNIFGVLQPDQTAKMPG